MTATDTESALLAAIVANPADDLPRLVYADWLDENGQPERAEFIRVQCELAKPYDVHAHTYWLGQLDTPIDVQNRKKLRRRERELYAQFLGGSGRQHADTEFHGRDVVWGYNWPSEVLLRHQRGFVSHVTASYETLFGGECGRCQGSGEIPYLMPDGLDRTCKHCTDGRTSGIAADLFRAQPVQSVTLTGKKPLSNRGVGSYFNEPDPPEMSVWVKGTGNSSIAWELPVEMWTPELGYWFNSSDLALQALSAAAVRLGRERAGCVGSEWRVRLNGQHIDGFAVLAPPQSDRLGTRLDEVRDAHHVGVRLVLHPHRGRGEQHVGADAEHGQDRAGAVPDDEKVALRQVLTQLLDGRQLRQFFGLAHHPIVQGGFPRR